MMHSIHLRPTPCTTGQVHLLVIYKGSIVLDLLQLRINDCEYLAFSIVHIEVAVYHTLKWQYNFTSKEDNLSITVKLAGPRVSII